MAQSLSYPSSEWIGFLRNYGPIPCNDNMYDETIQRASKRKKIQPPAFETAYLNELIENFRAAIPKSVILTGTAGDGKTYYCRQVWDALGGSLEVWQKETKNNWHVLPLQDKKLVVVKDLSELTAEEKQTLLPHVAAAIAGKSTDGSDAK